MTEFTVSTEQQLVKFGHSLAAMNVRSFEPVTSRARLVCFHGFVGNARDFDPLGAFLAANGVTVVAADMFGRGDSAHFSAGGQYNLRRLMQAAAAVLARHGDGATILGCGWGGLIGLLGAAVSRPRLRSFVTVDLPLDYSVDTDPVIAQAMIDRGMTFPSAETALSHLRNAPEFAALPAGAELGHRIRQDGGIFRLSHDEAITERTQFFGGREYDLRDMLAGLRTRVLMLHAGDASLATPTAITAIGGLGPRGPLLLRSALEHYLVLGAVLADPAT